LTESWLFWALLSAGFAALTAIFAKIGVGPINSDFATFIRTLVVIAALAGFLSFTSQWQALHTIPVKSWVFLLLSGLATGASWVAYFRALKIGSASQVAPVDKLSIVLVTVFATLFLGEKLLLTGWLGVAMIACGAILVAWR
jgi:bacterial/archaeal transporter family protein